MNHTPNHVRNEVGGQLKNIRNQGRITLDTFSIIPISIFSFIWLHPSIYLFFLFNFFFHPKSTSLISITILHMLDLPNPAYFSQYSIKANTININKYHNHTNHLPYFHTVITYHILLSKHIVVSKTLNHGFLSFHLSVP